MRDAAPTMVPQAACRYTRTASWRCYVGPAEKAGLDPGRGERIVPLSGLRPRPEPRELADRFGVLPPSASQRVWHCRLCSPAFAALLLPAEGIGDRYARRVALIAGLTIFGGGAASRRPPPPRHPPRVLPERGAAVIIRLGFPSAAQAGVREGG